MGGLRKNTQLMSKSLKDLFLVLHFSCITSMTFLMIICNIAIYTDDMVSVIRHLIGRNNNSWLLNLILTYGALSIAAESGLLISVLEKLSLFSFNSLITLVLKRIGGPVFKEK